MKKPLYFDALSEQAKRVASSEVYIKEAPNEDFSTIVELLQEAMQEVLEKNHLTSNHIEWENRYGVSVDMTSVRTTKEFFTENLSEEDYELYQYLIELCNHGMEEITYDGDTDFDFEYDFSDVEEDIGYEFLSEYGTAEEKEQFVFIDLLEEEYTEEQLENLQNIVIPLAESHAERIGEQLAEKAAAVREEIEKMLKKSVEYHESDEYYYDLLEDEYSYLYENYQFNEEGEIVCKGGDILFQFEEEYEEYMLSQETV